MPEATQIADLAHADSPSGPEYPWFAVRVKGRHEKVTASALRGKGYEPFLPLYHPRSSRARVELPLFPGYVFCRFDPRQRLPILICPGALHIVGAGREPVPVDGSEIAAIRRVAESGVAAEPWPFLKLGQRLTIRAGALAGVEGTLVRFKTDHRFIVSVSLLQRSVALEIGPELVI